MNIKELDDSLPNGFHDAMLESFSVNYGSGSAVLKLQILVGDPESSVEPEREAYRAAEVHLSGICYFVIEAPDQKLIGTTSKVLWIDGGSYDAGSAPPCPVPLAALPQDISTYWFYVREWNSFIHVAVRDANIQWCSKDPQP